MQSIFTLLDFCRSALAEVTNELEERQQRWSQIESLCGFQIMSQTSFGIGKGNGTRPRTGSAIAQALVNVANVAGVSSGRKISSSASPWSALPEGTSQAESKEDLPPTYSAVTANLAASDVVSEKPPRDKKNSADLKCDGDNCSDVEADVGKTTEIRCSDADNGHPSYQLGSTAMVNGIAESENKDHSLEHLVSSCGASVEEETALNGSSSSDYPAGKHKKRLSWFGKRQDSTTESESSAAENEEETRRKIRWLWRSAIRKSKAQRNAANKGDVGLLKAASMEKLKSG